MITITTDIPKIYNDPIISRKRSGDALNPYKRIKESITLDKSARALLTEIPNREDRVKVSYLGKELYEVEDEFLSEDTFRVDYLNGTVYFHESLANKTLNFEYTGEGVYLFPDSRVYSTDGEFLTVKDKLKDIDRAILVERHRIDEQILSHPQPSEVVDMRIDYNGKIYRVAKDRIDAEQRKIEEAYIDAKGVKYNSLKERIDSLQLATESQLDDIGNEITSIWSEVNLIPGKIELEVGRLEKDLDGYIQLLQSQINLIPEQIQLKVQELKEYVDGELDYSHSLINMLSDQIELKVNKNDVVSAINLSPEGVRISGNKIWITGETRIDNSVIKSAHIESISADKITAGMINADLVTIANNKIRLDNNGLYVYKNGIEGASLVEGNLTFNDQSSGQRIGRFAATVWSDGTTKGISMNMEPNRYISFGHWTGSETGYTPMVVFNPGTAIEGVPRGLVSNIPYRANDDIWVGSKAVRFGLNNTHNHSSIWHGTDNSLIVASYTGVRLAYLTTGGVVNNRLTVDNNSVDIWQDLDMHGWKILRVGSLQYNSNVEYKTDIRKWEESALEKIKSSVIYEYKLKQDVDKGILLNKHGLVIGDGYETPSEFVEQNFIDVYQMTSWAWKAIQELDLKADNIVDDIEWLKIENNYLKQKVSNLETRIKLLEEMIA